MFNFYSLSSGSSGNCLLVESDKTKILIDVGISMRKINLELSKLNLSFDDIDAIFISHEHIDHCKALESIYKKYNIPLYINSNTLASLNIKLPNECINSITNDNKYKLQDLNIKPFDTSHDAANPFGFTISKGTKKISIATDLGTVTDDVTKALKNSDFAYLEANYDVDMLNAGKYPYILKRRISSNTGHLSNIQCSNLIKDLALNNTKKFMLGHLSKENNFPELAIKTIESSLITNNISLKEISIDVANRDCLSKAIKLED